MVGQPRPPRSSMINRAWVVQLLSPQNSKAKGSSRYPSSPRNPRGPSTIEDDAWRASSRKSKRCARPWRTCSPSPALTKEPSDSRVNRSISSTWRPRFGNRWQALKAVDELVWLLGLNRLRAARGCWCDLGTREEVSRRGVRVQEVRRSGAVHRGDLRRGPIQRGSEVKIRASKPSGRHWPSSPRNRLDVVEQLVSEDDARSPRRHRLPLGLVPLGRSENGAYVSSSHVFFWSPRSPSALIGVAYREVAGLEKLQGYDVGQPGLPRGFAPLASSQPSG